ncbi:proline and serine-rich protein 3 isoform X2 [Dendropsophus ebraccatus]
MRTPYHPSAPQTLTEAQKQTVLSPDRLRSLPPHLSDPLSPPDLRFLVGSQQLVPGLPESDSSEPFDESWPSTESSSKTPERDQGLTMSDKERVPGCEGSVLARYITRFRSGRPTSRRERSPPLSGLKDFWWLPASPESPEMPRDRADSGNLAPLDDSPHSLEKTPTLEESSLSESVVYPDDVDTAGLQLRAGKLIQRSESSLSSGGPVSSVGQGSSLVSTVSSSSMRPPPLGTGDGSRMRPPTLDIGDGSRMRPPPLDIGDGSRMRPPLLGTVDSSRMRPPPLDIGDGSRMRPPTLDTAPVVQPTLSSIRVHAPLTPEEDILYQWRLRRKMEQAREGTLPVITRRRSLSPPLRIPRQVVHTEVSTNPLYQVSPAGAALSSPQPPLIPVAPSGDIPPHLHHLCDILPCVHSQTTPCVPRVRQTEMVHPRNDGVLHLLRQQRKVPPERQMEEKKIKPKGCGRKRDKTEAAQRGPSRSSASPVPESPIHRAMEQVISERLFSPLPSPKTKSAKRERRRLTTTTEDDADPQTIEVTAQQRPPTPSTQDDAEPQTIEIAAHLLEEAEDSDGTDFADDPLLQVLRDQRESLRSRLRTVDSRLAELEQREQ